MAISKNDPFPGTDYSQYMNWEPVQMPNGEVYYVVPGYQGYVLDPVASNASGRKVFRRNPKAELEAYQKEQAYKDQAIKQELQAKSPLGQLMPVGAGLAGTVAANYLNPVAADPLKEALAAQIRQQTQAAAQGAVNNTSMWNQPLEQVLNTNVTPTQLAPVAPISPPVGVGPIADGSAYAANIADSAPMFGSGGSLFNTEGMLGEAGSFAPLNVAGAALGAYGAYNASKMQNKRQGIMSGAASGALAGSSVLPGVGTAIGAVLGGLAGAAAHETTKHRSQRRYGELGEMGGGSNFQNLVAQGAQESLSGADTWDIGDDKSKAPIDLMTRSYGVLKTFGPQWASVDNSKKQEIVKKLVDNDLLNSKQGDYLIDNPEQAQAIMQSVLNPSAAPKSAAPVAVNPAQAAAQGAIKARFPTMRR